jgi:hypothetical protein
MKKKINIWQCMTATVMLLAINNGSYAQESLIDERWQQRMLEISSLLKEEWTEVIGTADWIASRRVDLTPEDLLNVVYIPNAHFVLDHDPYLKLTSGSNLEFLIKLDTTLVDYIIFNRRVNKPVLQCGGRFKEGRWISGGFGIYDSVDMNFISKLLDKNISLCKLTVSVNPETNFSLGYYLFAENGRLMCFRPDTREPQPLLKTLLEYRKSREERSRAATAMGDNYW